MPMSGAKKSPLSSVPYLKKRLRRITALGFHNLTVNEFNFTVHFTLHRNEKTVAFYTSETIENQRNPEWSYLEFPPNVQCLQEFLMRVWITSSNHCQLCLEYDIHLDNSLLPYEQENNDNNSLWIEMFGYRFSDNGTQLHSEEILSVDTRRHYATKSYNKLSIIRMNNIIHAIRSEQETSTIYLERLETYFNANKDYLLKIKERDSRQLYIENIKQYLHFQTYLYQQRLIIHQQKQKLIEERRNQLHNNLSELSIQENAIISCNNYINKSKSVLHNLTEIITYRQREIISEIYQYIYPINCNSRNEYSIANIKLPAADDKIYQSGSSREHDHEISAALGYCSHFILIFSQFIQLPLKYPINYHGVSAIKIYDYSLETSEYPLYPTSNLSAFRYGLYLLNRNIGQIMYHCRIGDRETDFRNTLENLKKLLEQYFIKSNNNHQQQIIKSVNHLDEQLIVNKRNSLFLSSCSSVSSNDYDQNEDIDLIPQLNTIKPRLVMQISQQIQN